MKPRASPILTRAGEVADAWALQSKVADRISALAAEGRAPTGFNVHFGNTLMRLTHYPEALSYFDAAASEAARTRNDRWVAHAAYMRGIALVRTGRTPEALTLFNDAEQHWRTTRLSNTRMLNELELQRGRVAREEGDFATAKAKVDRVYPALHYPESKTGAGISSALFAAAQTYPAAGDAAAVQGFARDGEAVANSIARKPEFSAHVAQARLLLGKALVQLKREREAAPVLQSAMESLSHGFGQDHPETLDAISTLTDCCRVRP
jgi:tetratricopeptide (TPR) repeat protein